MLLFCPTCGNVLIVEEGQKCMRFACNTCPYVHNITRKVNNRKYPKLKEVDDVLGGAAAWENVDSTAETCPKCGHPRAYFMQIQTRSADEPMTTFYKCCNAQCGHRWRDWNLCTLNILMNLMGSDGDPAGYFQLLFCVEVQLNKSSFCLCRWYLHIVFTSQILKISFKENHVQIFLLIK